MIVLFWLHPHIWNKSLMYLRKMKQNAFSTEMLYLPNSWTTSRHRARKWNKTHIWTIPKNETNHLFYCFLENETKRICIQLSWNHLPYPYCFLENETKRSHRQADRKQMSLPPFWKIKQNILDLTLLKNETKRTSLWYLNIYSCITPLKRLYICTPLIIYK